MMKYLSAAVTLLVSVPSIVATSVTMQQPKRRQQAALLLITMAR